jgi:uncharacterized membrane protein YoaK (UPF0700 family)
MLITPGTQRDAVIDQRLAVTLASIAGGINAAAFYAVGFFSANMTGNVSILSDHLATGAFASAWLYVAIVFAFITGAAACTFVVLAGERREMTGPYAFVVLFEGLLLAPLAAVDLWVTGSIRVDLLVVWLAFLMGMQNAVVTRLSNARVRTTHVSGMATDLGIEIALAWKLHGRTNPNSAGNITRLRLHLTTIVAFLLGGVGGVMLYQFCGGYAFLFASALLCLFGLRGLGTARRRSGLAQ